MSLIPKELRSFSDLGLPPILEKFTEHSQGFVVITGPTGSGKSTTLAAMIDKINSEKRKHIITIEDPIEYVFEHKQSLISQREVGSDTNSFARALRSSLREDPDVVLIGEMRDLETIEAAITLAETGHLVLTTLHTNSAAQTADRIVNVFPPHMQQQISSQLASVLLGVVSQRLIPKINGGRVMAAEIMIANAAIKSLIRDGKNYQIPNVIQTSAADGMISLDKVLAEYVSRGDITLEEALNYSLDPKSFKMMVY
jgi:twitching motility protein PilT